MVSGVRRAKFDLALGKKQLYVCVEEVDAGAGARRGGGGVDVRAFKPSERVFQLGGGGRRGEREQAKALEVEGAGDGLRVKREGAWSIAGAGSTSVADQVTYSWGLSSEESPESGGSSAAP